MTLTEAEQARIKNALIDFVVRVAKEDIATPDEVAALPAVARLLLEDNTTFFATGKQ